MYSSRANRYDRASAVKYARRYALNPNPYYRYFSLSNTGGDCSNFLSQCLYSGGAPMNSSWWYRRNSPTSTRDDTWSITWSVAHSLYWYLKRNAASNLPGIKGHEVNAATLLEPGDLMFFEENSGHIFHSAIVTSIYNNQVLISHHSFEALDIPYLKSWPAKKIHFVKISL